MITHNFIGCFRKAQVIQDKIAESSVVKLPRMRRPGRSSQKSGKHSSAAACYSQHSLPDSGHASSTNDPSQGDDRQPPAEPSDLPSLPCSSTCPIGEDDLPDLVDKNHSDGLCDSHSQSDSQQNVRKESKVPQESQESRSTMRKEDSQPVSESKVPPGCQDSQESQSTVRREDSQPVSERDACDTVEEFDSPPPAVDSLSQRIEDVESLSLKDCDSQRSEDVVNLVSDSLEPGDACDAGETDSGGAHARAAGANDDDDNESSGVGGSATPESRQAQPCANVSHEESDLGQTELAASSPVRVAEKEGGTTRNDGDAVTPNADTVSEETVVSSLQAARQKAVEELAGKGVVPALSRGNGRFILLDESVAEKARGKNALMDRLLKQYKKREPKKPADVEIR